MTPQLHVRQRKVQVQRLRQFALFFIEQRNGTLHPHVKLSARPEPVGPTEAPDGAVKEDDVIAASVEHCMSFHMIPTTLVTVIDILGPDMYVHRG